MTPYFIGYIVTCKHEGGGAVQAHRDIMDTLFEDLKQGLEEAIARERGNKRGKQRTLRFKPVTQFGADEIRAIRKGAGMSLAAMASYMGVSQKTVEAWEAGRNHPTGPAYRLLELLKKDKDQALSFIDISTEQL